MPRVQVLLPLPKRKRVVHTALFLFVQTVLKSEACEACRGEAAYRRLRRKDMELEMIKSMKRNLGLHITEEAKTGIEYPQWQAIKIREMRKYQRQNKSLPKNRLTVRRSRTF